MLIDTFASCPNRSSILYWHFNIRLVITLSRGLFVPADPFNELPSKGSLPQRIANKTTPNDHISSGGPVIPNHPNNFTFQNLYCIIVK
jgi:hypothetical protein